jgi:pyruvate carboxylase
MTEIRSILAANRSEIAIRIFRAANEIGVRTIAIYSHEDRLSLHRFKADEAYQIGAGKGPVEAYLDIESIVSLARARNVDAIHPGYGFLSENPAFASACRDAGITFIGPTPELLQLLGDKTAARKVAASAGVPVLPGTDAPVKSAAEARRLAREIGFPLILKAAMGGGGRGIRVVPSASQLDSRLEEARNEAQSAFGDASIFLEKYLPSARHIEVQILADHHGAILHLWREIARFSGATRKLSKSPPRRVCNRRFAGSYARQPCVLPAQSTIGMPARWSSYSIRILKSGISSRSIRAFKSNTRSLRWSPGLTWFAPRFSLRREMLSTLRR